ncbi:formate dehydrogenase accessory sulfurtransferase FdhD [Gemmobacter denitrificans]|uniref:Sulfur carrier protein FdhD n=1 Tax=Gemmobacter denitrificans TaxID=3123040 RepID=A0ABU8BV54_9RHOB
MMDSHRPLPRLAFTAGALRPGSRDLPEEVAVALSYNGSTHAVMMATPSDLEDFAKGFTLTEGIAALDEIDSITAVETPRGIDLQIWLADPAADRQAKRRRSMAGPVGCGLCGIDSLDEAMRSPRPVPRSDFAMSPAQVMAAMADLEAHQPLHDITRAAHCAALWADGGIIAAREDVGRHNALDKLIGATAPLHAAALVLTCRTSVDMVQKACAAGFPVLIAVSAPTAAAVTLADQAGLTLIALARPDRFEIFTHPHRIAPQEAAHVA